MQHSAHSLHVWRTRGMATRAKTSTKPRGPKAKPGKQVSGVSGKARASAPGGAANKTRGALAQPAAMRHISPLRLPRRAAPKDPILAPRPAQVLRASLALDT